MDSSSPGCLSKGGPLAQRGVLDVVEVLVQGVAGSGGKESFDYPALTHERKDSLFRSNTMFEKLGLL